MALAFRDVVLPLCGLVNAGAVANRQTTLFIAHHGLITIDDMNLLQPEQGKELVKQFNQRHPNSSMGILVQNNLTGLIWYVKDKTRRACNKSMSILFHIPRMTIEFRDSFKSMLSARDHNPKWNDPSSA